MLVEFCRSNEIAKNKVFGLICSTQGVFGVGLCHGGGFEAPKIYTTGWSAQVCPAVFHHNSMFHCTSLYCDLDIDLPSLNGSPLDMMSVASPAPSSPISQHGLLTWYGSGLEVKEQRVQILPFIPHCAPLQHLFGATLVDIAS